MRARLLLAAIVLTAFTLSAQQQRGAAASRATAGSTPRQAHAHSESIGEPRHSTPANVSGARILDRLRVSVLLGVFDDEASAPEDVRLLAGRVSPYPMPGGVARPVYAEPGEAVYTATRVIEKPDALPTWQLTDNSGSGCWWLWVFTGVPFCS